MNLQIEKKQVFFTDTGELFDQNKRSIILLHGSGQSHVVWSLTTQYLSDQNYNVFALDFPGHGNSEGVSLRTIEEMAEWLEKVIIKIGIQNLTLVGHSQGCLVALEYAKKFPKDQIKSGIKIKDFIKNNKDSVKIIWKK